MPRYRVIVVSRKSEIHYLDAEFDNEKQAVIAVQGRTPDEVNEVFDHDFATLLPDPS